MILHILENQLSECYQELAKAKAHLEQNPNSDEYYLPDYEEDVENAKTAIAWLKSKGE
jgi:hypothetical protein